MADTPAEIAAYGGAAPQKKLTVPDLVAMKKDGKRITMMTAYDAAFARLVDHAGIDVLLVGDSAGMVMLGYANTVPVTMDDMVRQAAAVSRGATRPLLIGDMPFGSYQTGTQDALRMPLQQQASARHSGAPEQWSRSRDREDTRRQRHFRDGPRRPHAAACGAARRLKTQARSARAARRSRCRGSSLGGAPPVEHHGKVGIAPTLPQPTITVRIAQEPREISTIGSRTTHTAQGAFDNT